MKGFAFTFVLAAVLSAALTPLVRRVALRWGAVSRPGGRNVNERPIPRLGGVSIFVAFWVPLVALLFIDSRVADLVRAEGHRMLGLAVGGVMMSALLQISQIPSKQTRASSGREVKDAAPCQRSVPGIDARNTGQHGLLPFSG